MSKSPKGPREPIAPPPAANPPRAVEQGVSKRRGKDLPWRKDPVILARLVEVERRHLAGHPNTAIAVVLGVNEITIRRDMERLHELWRERTGGAVADMRAQAVAELDDIARRAIDAAEWDQMCEQAVLFNDVAAGENISTLSGEPARRRVYRDEKGSAQFRGQKAQALNVARQARMDKAKILGVVVDKVSPTDPDGNALDLASLVLAARAAKESD